MTRTKLPDRRASETRKIIFTYANGEMKSVIITIGFDDLGIPKEVFCADFKVGSDMQAIVMDSCILVSRCLQHGDDAEELVAAMCKGPSLIGAIMAAVADSRGSPFFRVSSNRPKPPKPATDGARLAELVQ